MTLGIMSIGFRLGAPLLAVMLMATPMFATTVKAQESYRDLVVPLLEQVQKGAKDSVTQLSALGQDPSKITDERFIQGINLFLASAKEAGVALQDLRAPEGAEDIDALVQEIAADAIEGADVLEQAFAEVEISLFTTGAGLMGGLYGDATCTLDADTEADEDLCKVPPALALIAASDAVDAAPRTTAEFESAGSAAAPSEDGIAAAPSAPSTGNAGLLVASSTSPIVVLSLVALALVMLAGARATTARSRS